MKKGKNGFWNEERIASAVEQFIQTHERLPVAREMRVEYGLPSRRSFEKMMQMTWGQYTKLHFPELVELGEERHKQHAAEVRQEQAEWTEERLTAAVRQFAAQHGRLPYKREYSAENALPSYTTFCNIARQAMADHFEEAFGELLRQDEASQAEDAEELNQQGPSFGMRQTFK